MSEPQGLLRKAAILVSSLDTATADRLLDQMGPVKAAKVRNAVMELSRVDPREEERVIAEFLGRAPGRTSAPTAPPRDGGVELDESLTSKFAQRGTYAPPRVAAADEWNESAAPAPSAESDRAARQPRFEFLHDAPPEQLARVLHREYPQLIAVVMYHLPPERSAALLKQFEKPLQTEILRRIAHVEETDPEVMKDIEAELETLVRGKIVTQRKRGIGAAAVDAILSASDPAIRAELLAEMHGETAVPSQHVTPSPLPEPIGPRLAKWTVPAAADTPHEPEPSARAAAPSASELFVRTSSRQAEEFDGEFVEQREEDEQRELDIEFDDLARLENRSLAILIRHVDPRVLMLALAGAEHVLLDRLSRQLPAKESRALQQKIQNLGPLRLSDIDDAQYQLLCTAARLEQEGLLRLPTRVAA